jgi:HsdM N-terminal domain/Type I restriction modification DNA specificity domain
MLRAASARGIRGSGRASAPSEHHAQSPRLLSTTVTQQDLINFIWAIANKLRGPYRPPQYRRVMIPMTVLRRLDCVLEPTKDKLLARHAALKARKLDAATIEKTLLHEFKLPFFNTSRFTFARLMGVLIRPRADRLSPAWLVRCVYGRGMQEYIALLSGGSTVSHLNMSDIPNLPIAVPPLAEQAQAVRTLEVKMQSIDDVESNANATITALIEYRSTLVTSAVTGRIDVRTSMP